MKIILNKKAKIIKVIIKKILLLMNKKKYWLSNT